MADIPGLIEGAHNNRGLGHEFLRHIERTKALIYVIDTSGEEGRLPYKDFECLREELRLYDEHLSLRPSMVVANKMDDSESEHHLTKLQQVAAPLPVIPVWYVHTASITLQLAAT
eukprot:20952-Heterococcus_DN1.PRE.6